MGEIRKAQNIHILHRWGFFRFVVFHNNIIIRHKLNTYATTTQLTIANMISNAIEQWFKLSKWLSAALLQVVLT